MKNTVVITGGVGFVGSSLIKYLLNKEKNLRIISLDNYSSGTKKNEIKDKRIIYLRGETKNIFKILSNYKSKIHTIFHFGEFSRIYQSFLQTRKCFNSNNIGSLEVFNFCLTNKIKLVYSATSASIGNKGMDKNLSPYSFSKSINLEFLENLKKWFKFKCEIIYFYNVYGPGQIQKGKMSTVIGVFEEQFKKKIPLTVVRPGTQTRRFTHISDTVRVCYYAWKKNKNRHYSITHKKSYSILQVAKMFKFKIKMVPSREGERYLSAITDKNLSNKVYKIFGKINLKNYIKDKITSN